MSISLAQPNENSDAAFLKGNRILGLADARVVLAGILSLAFLGRAMVRFHYGEDDFWRNSYNLFYSLAESIAEGRGLCYEWFGVKCAHRPPVYPLFLVLSVFAGKSFVLIVILQSLIGAGTAFCAYLIGRDLFNSNAGLLAALGVAIYPYFVMHDTALQETGLFTFLTTLAVLLLIRARKSASTSAWLFAGVALGLAVLTRVTLVGFVPFAFLWVFLLSQSGRRAAVAKTAVVVLGFTLIVSPWLLRNYFLLGAPTLSTLSGLTLWAGNNPYTFTNYPIDSIDRSVGVAYAQLSQTEKDAIKQLSTDEIAQNSWFINKAEAYIRENPYQFLASTFTKVGAAFSWRLNPSRAGFVQTVYFVSYVPILLLGVAGIWFSRRRWRELSLIYALFLSFAALTAVFFSHTSHRVYLDVYLLIFAGYAMTVIYQWLFKQVKPAQLSFQSRS